MWVKSNARGCSPPSAWSSVGRQDSGPGSTSTSSTCQHPITRGRSRCMRSMTLIGRDRRRCSGQRPAVVVRRALDVEVDDRRRRSVVEVVLSEALLALEIGRFGLVRGGFGRILGGLQRVLAELGLVLEQPAGPDAGSVVGSRKAVCGGLGQPGELPGELARVLDDLLAL